MDFADLILHWALHHPVWAGWIVFAIAFAESLAIVGLFLPGAAMMFGVGALIGSGGMQLAPTLLWAACGAIAGDGISYWLGRHYHQQLRVMWPFRSHPVLVARSTDFFYRHGGKGVLLGRFIGPIRPVIPAVAGMLDMPPWRFFSVNIVSGILWAPVYVLPGMVFASTLGIAAEVATRLAILLGFVIAGVFGLFWLLRHTFNWLHRQTYPFLRQLLAWSRVHPVVGTLPAALLDPSRPEAKGLSMLALLLLLAAVCSAGIFSAMGEDGLLRNLDIYTYHWLQSLRTPAIDSFMGQVARLGSNAVLAALFGAILLWLGWRRRWSAALHWLAAGAFSSLMIWTIGRFIPLPEPPAIGDLADSHAAHSMVVYGFLGILIGRELNGALRALVYSLAGTLIVLVATTHIYLGINWLASTLGGLSFGLAWVMFLGIAYRQHAVENLPTVGLLGVTLLALAIALPFTHTPDLATQRDSTASITTEIRREAWLAGAWRELPQVRIDIRNHNEQPLALQYAGTLADLEQQLGRHGWHAPPALTASSWLKWLNKDAALGQMPILPHVHDGRHQALLLTHEIDGRSVALRLWPTHYRLSDSRQSIPLWVGTLGYLSIPTDSPLLRVPLTQDDYLGPVQDFVRQLPELGISSRILQRPHSGVAEILLIVPPKAGLQGQP